MAYKDLREFMALLEKRRLLVRVKSEVDPSWEINGVTRRLQEVGGPAVLFENVGGHQVPVLSELVGTPERLALALGMDSSTTEKQITEEWVRRIEHPVPPRLVSTGPCKENILKGIKADLNAVFPPVIWHKGDGGPFIGVLGLQVTRDPETGVQNTGIYRQMVRSKNETGLYMPAYQHGGQHLQKWARLYPGKPMPLAVVLGPEPCYLLAAGAKFHHPPGEDVYTGALRQEPLELVRCETCDIEVPATAEIILEGEVYPEEFKTDGPFGEYTGFLGGEQEFNVFHLKAITHRNNPIFQGTREGAPRGKGWVESGLLWIKGEEYQLYKELKKINGVIDVCVPLWCSGFHAVVSIRKLRAGQPFQIIQRIFGDEEFGSLIKHVIVVDENIDVRNPKEVEWAVANLVQGDRDILVVPRCPGEGLDTSQPYSKRFWTSKVGIDATVPTYEYQAEGRTPPPTCLDPDIVARVIAQWDKYGINI
ncbi:MAG: UbiD family decarboxylase [Chloroflexi bacterium]|nr:UbiD family decarboxylase [Chloroflexota bacterium]